MEEAIVLVGEVLIEAALQFGGTVGGVGGREVEAIALVLEFADAGLSVLACLAGAEVEERGEGRRELLEAELTGEEGIGPGFELRFDLCGQL